MAEIRIARIAEADVVKAPDGSEIRPLQRLEGGSVVHCRLAAGLVTRPVRHRTVEEIWFVLRGRAEIWQRRDGSEDVRQVVPGDCLTVPLGTDFQFRNVGHEALDLILLTMPPWPGVDEAILVEGAWRPTVEG